MGPLPVVMAERAVGLIVAVGWALVWFLVHGSLVGSAWAPNCSTSRIKNS